MKSKVYIKGERIILVTIAIIVICSLVALFCLLYNIVSQSTKYKETNINFAIGKDPNNANYYAALASLKGMHQDNYEEAFDNIKKAVEMNPSNADYLMLLARIQYSRGNYNEAVAAYRKILNLPVENNVKETVLKNIEQIIGQRN